MYLCVIFWSIKAQETRTYLQGKAEFFVGKYPPSHQVKERVASITDGKLGQPVAARVLWSTAQVSIPLQDWSEPDIYNYLPDPQRSQVVKGRGEGWNHALLGMLQ